MSKVTIFTKYKSGQKTRWAIVFGQNVNWKQLQVLIMVARRDFLGRIPLTFERFADDNVL